MKYQETAYEDELDRIRARRNKKKAGIRPAERQKDIRSGRTAARRPVRNRWIVLVLMIVTLIAGAWMIKRVQQDDGYWTVAVFGLDSREGNTGKGALADVQLIASVNRKTGEIRLASVFRDTYLQIEADGDYNKINEAYFLGGHEQAVTALQDNFDLQIDDCVTFNWKAVADAINVLGGIDLEITDREFAYINSFITETVESTGIASTHLQKSGMNHLDGVQAVAYARLRLMDTDFKRTERQRKVIGLTMEKAKQANFKTLRTLVGTVYPEIFTTIRVDDILVLAKNAKKYYIGQTSGFPFSHTEMKISKKSCVVPATLESNVVQLHAFLYDDTGYTPSDLVKYISAHISEVSGITEPGKDTESGKNIGAQDNTGNSQGTSAKNPGTDAAVNAEVSENTAGNSIGENTEETNVETMESVEETVTENGEWTGETDGDGNPIIKETEIPLETTNPENMEQGPGISSPNRVSGPGSIFDMFRGDEEETISPGEEPGTAAPEDSVTGPGTAQPGDPQNNGSPTVNAGSSHGNALEGPPGESKTPTESAATGVRPGEA